MLGAFFAGLDFPTCTKFAQRAVLRVTRAPHTPPQSCAADSGYVHPIAFHVQSGGGVASRPLWKWRRIAASNAGEALSPSAPVLRSGSAAAATPGTAGTTGGHGGRRSGAGHPKDSQKKRNCERAARRPRTSATAPRELRCCRPSAMRFSSASCRASRRPWRRTC